MTKLHFNLCLQDLDQTETSAEIAKALAATGKFKITRVDPAIEAAKYAKDNKVNLVLVIPKDYEKSYTQISAIRRPQRIRYPHVCLRPQLQLGG